MRKCAIVSVLILLEVCRAFSQGFLNLDFESANLSGFGTGPVPATNAIPGWTAYIGGTPLTDINYNVNPSAGVGAYIYNSPNLQGSYFAYIQGTVAQPVAIGQTGTIPITAQSLIWWGQGGGVSFNGQALSVSSIGSGPHYLILEADISAFAGQTGQLLFTSTSYPLAPGNSIDNIQFSPSPVPEPGVLGLLGMGSLCFLWHRRKAKAN